MTLSELRLDSFQWLKKCEIYEPGPIEAREGKVCEVAAFADACEAHTDRPSTCVLIRYGLDTAILAV